MVAEVHLTSALYEADARDVIVADLQEPTAQVDVMEHRVGLSHAIERTGQCRDAAQAKVVAAVLPFDHLPCLTGEAQGIVILLHRVLDGGSHLIGQEPE